MDQKEFNNIISAFKTAHQEKEKIQVTDNWQIRVMSLIRDKTGNDLVISFYDLFQQLVWRLVPVTCVLALLLGILLTQINFLSDYEMEKLFINDPSDLSMLSIYDE